MKRFLISVCVLFLLLGVAFAQGPSIVAVMASTNGALRTPTNFFYTNIFQGTNIVIQRTNGGAIWIHSTASGTGGGPASGTNAFAVLSYQTNYTFGISTAAVYHTVTGYFASSAVNCSVDADAGSITNTYANWYLIHLSSSFSGSGGVGDVFEMGVFTNNVEVPNIEWIRKTASTDSGSAAGHGILYLAAGTRVDTRIQNTAATGNIGLRKHVLSIVALTPGEGTPTVTNFNGIYVTNAIFGTNQTFYTTTNTPNSILTWSWFTNLAGVFGGTYLTYATNAVTSVGIDGALIQLPDGAAATNINFISGTNILLRGTNNAGVISLQINTGPNPTNFNSIYVTNFIRGTNYDFYTATNIPQGIMTWEWWTNKSWAIAGQTNYNGEASITNASRIGLVHGRTGNTNTLRSIQAGGGITLTNQDTNIVIAMTAAINDLTDVNIGAAAATGDVLTYNQALAYWTNLPQTASGSVISNAFILYVAKDGDDSTAKIGRQDLPWATVTNAVTSAPAGVKSVVRVGPGTFEQTTPIKLGNNVSLVGAGRLATILTNGITGATAGAQVSPGNNSVVRDLSIHTPTNTTTTVFPFGSTAAQSVFTNAVLADVDIRGGSDCLYIEYGTNQLRVYNCSLHSMADAILLYADAGGTVVELYNCDHVVRSNLGNPAVGVWAGTVRLFGGNLAAITASGVPNSAIQTITSDAVVEAYGTRLFATGDSGSVAVDNAAGGTVRLLSTSATNWTGTVEAVLRLSDLQLPTGATSNYVWTCTNATTGSGEWRVASGVAVLSAYATNAVATVSLDDVPVTTPDDVVATNVNFISGTNVVIHATNNAGVVSVQINAAASGVADSYPYATNATATISLDEVPVTTPDDVVVTNINFVSGTNVVMHATNNAGILSLQVNAAGAGIGDAGGTNARQFGSLVLSNIHTIGISNVGSGTNISIRSAGGTNFVDTTGQLNNWALYTTNVVTNAAVLAAAAATNGALANWTLFTTNVITNSAVLAAAAATNGALADWTKYGTNVIGSTATNSTRNILVSSNFLQSLNGAQPTNNVLTMVNALSATNEPFGGTNISVRRAGGTNFIDTTGYLNNWSLYPTSIVAGSSAPGGADFMLQFNSGGSLAGLTNSGATNSTGTLGASNMVLSGNLSVAGTNTVGTLEVGTMILTNPISSASVTNGTADTVAIWGPDKRATNTPNGTGMLTNNGSGVFGWMAIPTGGSGSTQMVTFAAGTATITNAATIFGNLTVGTNLTVSNAMNIGTLNVDTLNATNITFGKTNWFPGNVRVDTNLWVDDAIYVGGTNLHALAATAGDPSGVTNSEGTAVFGFVKSTNVLATNIWGGAVFSGGTNLHELAARTAFDGMTANTLTVSNALMFVSSFAPNWKIFQQGSFLAVSNYDGNAFEFGADGFYRNKGTDLYHGTNYYTGVMVTNVAQTIAYSVTNNTRFVTTNSVEFIKTNKITSVDGNIVVRQDGSGGVTLSNAIATAVAPISTNYIGATSMFIDMQNDATVAVTNGFAATTFWLTNIVDRKWFVLRCGVTNGASTITITNAAACTMNVINTNGFSVTTLPQVPVAANKIATIVGRAWVIAGTTNVDLFGSVQQ